jgi:hypothetical protein
MATKKKRAERKPTGQRVVDATGSAHEAATRALEKMHRDASRLLRRERANAPNRPDAPPKGCSARTWRTAVHEAGHVVAAHMLGIPLGPVTIVPGKGPDGVAFLGRAKLNVDPHHARRAWDEYYDSEDELGDADAERRREDESLVFFARQIQISFAGMLAEEIFFGAADGGLQHDLHSIAMCADRVCPPDAREAAESRFTAPPNATPEEIRALLAEALERRLAKHETELFQDWLKTRARKLVEHSRREIDAVARALVLRKRLTPKRAMDAIHLARRLAVAEEIVAKRERTRKMK